MREITPCLGHNLLTSHSQATIPDVDIPFVAYVMVERMIENDVATYTVGIGWIQNLQCFFGTEFYDCRDR